MLCVMVSKIGVLCYFGFFFSEKLTALKKALKKKKLCVCVCVRRQLKYGLLKC